MTWGLRTRLTLSYVLVALLCVLMVSALANGVLESSFRRYVRESQARQVQQVVAQIGTQRTRGRVGRRRDHRHRDERAGAGDDREGCPTSTGGPSGTPPSTTTACASR